VASADDEDVEMFREGHTLILPGIGPCFDAKGAKAAKFREGACGFGSMRAWCN
jgi:hypothetical protein